MDFEARFRESLPLIDRVIGEVCRRARVRDADAEDFASVVRIALIENDYEILRKWEGRSTLAGYLSIVIRRLLADQRIQELGRWHPSAEAKRLGNAAILLDRLLHRDGRALEEAIPLVRALEPSLSEKDVRAMAASLPARDQRARPVALEEIAEPAAEDRADAGARDYDAHRIATRAAQVVRETMAKWPDEDVVILRFRYGGSMTIADISRALRIPQRPLYRRLEARLGELRQALVSAGLDAATLAEVTGNAVRSLDFGLDSWKNADARPSSQEEVEVSR
ncbi:MAG: hypothetical protein JOZ54_13075 [Acidobacteria bacterium]|nr:hypothetical protein [Acidobacteriota bacterium]